MMGWSVGPRIVARWFLVGCELFEPKKSSVCMN